MASASVSTSHGSGVICCGPRESEHFSATCWTKPGVWGSMSSSSSWVLASNRALKRGGWPTISPTVTSVVQIRPATFLSGSSARIAQISECSFCKRTPTLFLPPEKYSKFSKSHASGGRRPPLRFSAQRNTSLRAISAFCAESLPNRVADTRKISNSRTTRGIRAATGLSASQSRDLPLAVCGL